MGLSQGNSVLNFNSLTKYKALNNVLLQINPSTLFPFPVNLGDVLSQPNYDIDPQLPKGNIQDLKMGPGLYAIVCSNSGKLYFGQSENVVQRLGSHYGQLVGNKHECKDLQKDWATHGEESFSFLSLSVSPKWANTTVRQQAEDQLITLNPTIVYNQSIAGSVQKKLPDIYKKQVSFKGTIYSTIAEASRKTYVSETHIRRLIRDPKNTDWQYVGDQSHFGNADIVNIDKALSVMIHGQIYRSIRDAAKATGIARRTLQRHLESDKPEHLYATYVEVGI
jgi:hypothetical protein